MPAPASVLKLCETFADHRPHYRSGSYNEAQLRKEFLDPFFAALGWDMDNKAGLAPQYRDVIHEDALRVGVHVKAPDYAFTLHGQRKFFLEAKKPAVNIKTDIDPAFQLRRYAWSAKMPLSILSDFEEFAIYDTRVKPVKNDPTSKARTFYCTFDQYPEKWDEIAAIFSRDAILKGSFDKYAESNKKKKGTAEVDAAFLAEIERWRDLLARNLALRNPALSVRDLNFAVQKTIDRLVFLRICEDRGTEDYGRLRTIANGTQTYPRLLELFRAADARYNSGLFHFSKEKGQAEEPDTLTPHLALDDKVLKDIIVHLYYPDSPYEFSVLPADILGSVYEQFLGKVITLTAGHRAHVEDKPEVKKAGGVFYTPSYIVDYIVKQTVGPLVEGKTPKQIESIRVLDPACGSGSFLIVAYQFLLDWYHQYYIANDPEKLAKGKNPVLVPSRLGGWVLTTAERKRILLTHIFGVDIDSQAVEVTKLSLLLKVLEGETSQSLQRELIHQRVLPDLGDNIKCGNSLIASDFYAQPGLPEMDADAHLRVNVFDWDGKHGFPEIMKAGGFDAVIGNPPYVRQESITGSKNYLQSRYEAYDGVADLYAYFMERGVKLLKPGGLYSIIVSSSFLRTSFAKPLRRVLKKHATIRRIVDFGGLPVFASAKDTYVCIPLLERGGEQEKVEVCNVPSLSLPNLFEYVAGNHHFVPSERLNDEGWALKSDEEAALLSKVMQRGIPLGEYVDRKMFYGLKTGLNEAFVINSSTRSALIEEYPASAILIHMFLGGQDIRRFEIREKDQHLIVIPCGFTRKQMSSEGKANSNEKESWAWLKQNHGAIARHLESFAVALRKRSDQGDFWWELRPCDYYSYFDAPKILFPDICKGPRFYPDDTGIYIANTAYCLGTGDRYLLGFLNSRLFWFAIANISVPFGVRAGEFRYRLIYQYMEKVPVRVIDPANKSDIASHDRIVVLVEKMLDLHKQRSSVKTPHEQTALDRQISATDAQIDRLVYDLYGLTEDEIKLVEGA
jgi:SAM-dependent methyltransferase